jgi:hypothetical protein
MRLRFVLLAIATYLLTTLAPGQDIYYPPEKVDLAFDPNIAIEKLARQKAAALDRRWQVESEKMRGDVTNWEEYDITYYDINVIPDFNTEILYGIVGIYGYPVVAELDSITINFSDINTLDSLYNASGPLTYARSLNHVTVYLDRAYLSGEIFSFTVVYSAFEHDWGGIYFYTRDGYPAADVFTEPYGSRAWWPCNDMPQDKADSIDVHITVDTALWATSNGLLIADVGNGDETHTLHWRERYPIATYLTSIAVGRYIRWDDYYITHTEDTIPIINFLQPDEYDTSIITLAVTNDAMEVFENLFCIYPFHAEKYGITQTTGGGMEYQTNTALDPNYCKRDEIIVHELAHSWWGNMITCRTWGDIWLNEGFATYCEALFFEATRGTGYYHAYMLEKEWLDAGSVYKYDTTSNVLSSIVYRKGAWVLHMLRHLIGDHDFFAIMQQYAADFAYSTAVTEDFQNICESVTGDDLDWFFQQWVYGYDHPIYEYSAVIRQLPTGAGWNTYVCLEQAQITDPQIFIMPMDIQFWIGSGYTVEEVANDQREQLYLFHSAYRPDSIGIDPHNWILDEHNKTAFTLHIFTDSLNDGFQGEYYEDTIVIVAANEEFTAEIISGELPLDWHLDLELGIISGTSFDTGEYTFMIRATDDMEPGYVDTATYTIYIEDMGYGPGDANLDGEANVGDAVFLINYIFKGGPAPGVPNWADANADCEISVGDAVYIINYVFREGPAPQMGCVE